MTRTPRLAAYGAALLLAAVVTAESLQPAPAPVRGSGTELPLPSPVRPIVAAGAPDDAPLQSWVETILARPLFSRDRRPADAPAASAAAPDLPRLTGVAVSPAGRQAIFAAAAGGKPLVASVGDHVAGYVVQAIEPGAVTILGPGGPRLLQPGFAGPAPLAITANRRVEPNSGPLLDLPPNRVRFAPLSQP